MQKASFIFLALFIMTLMTSCGPKPIERQSGSIDLTLNQYLETFVSRARDNGVSLDTYSLSMSFSESMPQSTSGGFAIGYCQRSVNSQNVVIKESYWNSASVSDREQLVFHELGHCLLGLSHNDTTEVSPVWNIPNMSASGVPSSIMNTFHFGSGLYSGNRETYIKRLFSGASSMPLYWNAPPQISTVDYN